jgi:hypothetical protein
VLLKHFLSQATSKQWFKGIKKSSSQWNLKASSTNTESDGVLEFADHAEYLTKDGQGYHIIETKDDLHAWIKRGKKILQEL